MTHRTDEQIKAEAIQGFVIDLMLDANESIGTCNCVACQRLRRTARALEPSYCPTPRRDVKGQPIDGDVLP